jgi:hypothetical protein
MRASRAPDRRGRASRSRTSVRQGPDEHLASGVWFRRVPKTAIATASGPVHQPVESRRAADAVRITNATNMGSMDSRYRRVTGSMPVAHDVAAASA